MAAASGPPWTCRLRRCVPENDPPTSAPQRVRTRAKPRVVIAGLGDIGLLTAIHLSRHVDVVGISAKPGLVSGQELGVRLARPDDWARDNRLGFDRFRRLDAVRRVHGSLTGVDVDAREVTVTLADGTSVAEAYDALVISTGVSNGFWRKPDLQSHGEIDAEVRAHHETMDSAASVIVVGGGAAAVSVAANLRIRWPDKQVDLYFPGVQALREHHPRPGSTSVVDCSSSAWVCTPSTALLFPRASPATRSPRRPCSGALVRSPRSRKQSCGRSVTRDPTPGGYPISCWTTRASSP